MKPKEGKISSYVFTLLVAFLVIGASRCSHGVRLDLAMAAVDGGDYTALIEGCGNQLVPGYTYCRKMEGQPATDSLVFVAPAVGCLEKDPETGAETGPCVTFMIYFPDGSKPAYGGAIPRGQTRVSVPWSTILSRNTFELGDRGFWPYTYSIRYIGQDGRERTAVSQGEIRMRVMKKDYIPLDNVQEDANFVWKWQDNGVPVRMTTGARTFVGKRP